VSKLLRAALIVIGIVFLISGLLGVFGMLIVTSILTNITSMPGPAVPGLELLRGVLGLALALGWTIALLQLIAGVLSIAAGAAFKLSGKAG
jgi:uncharacterized protein YqhQ